MHHFTKVLMSCIAALWLFPATVLAQCPTGGDVLYVNASSTGANDGTSWGDAFTDLQDALKSSCPGITEIWVAQGTYYPTSGTNRNATFQLKNGLAIYGGFPNTGGPGMAERSWAANETILSGDINQSGDLVGNAYSVVTGSGTNATAMINGFTITGGNADVSSGSGLNPSLSGGGMYNNGGSPTVMNNTFSGNSAFANGGGMFNRDNSSPTVMHNTFSGNTARLGGGMFNISSSPTVTNSTFSGNTASREGGGMYNGENSSPTVTNCTFSGNTASLFGGGGMYNRSSSPMVTNCTFSGNSAIQGGGMYNFGSSPTITNVTFSSNSATQIYGGGMNNSSGSNPNLTYVTFTNNSAFLGGGGMSNSSSSPTITNCTFLGNLANNFGGGGGGMYNDSSSPTVTNSIFSNNLVDGMANESESYPLVTNSIFWGSGFNGIYNSSSSPTVTNCIIWGNSSGGIFNASSSSPIVNYSIVQGGYTGTNNLNTDPLFVNAAGGDFRLTALSPAINAGDPATNLSLFPGGPSDPEDLDGNPRVIGADIDMGAYENTDFNTCQTALPVEAGSCDVQLEITDGFNTFNGPVETCSGNSITGEADAWATVTIPAGNLPEDFITIQYDNSGVGPVSDIAIAVYTDCNDLAGSLMGCVDDLTVAGGMNVEGIESILIPVSGGETFYIRIINKTPQSASGKLSVFFAREIIYVNAAATTGANNGSSWADAFTDLQDALIADGRCTEATQIWVAAGTYYPDQGGGQTNDDRNATFLLKNDVAIYGGFNGTETQLEDRDWTANVTILSGDINQTGTLTGNSCTVVTGSGTNGTAVMDGFTITGGNADGTTESVTGPDRSGGGMYINTGSPTVTNCTFSGNSASAGGGMSNIQSSPTVTNCTFSGNSAITGGGMCNLSFSDPKVTNCTFSGNTASFGGGGGMYNQDCSLKVTNCTFSGNTASFGDGGGMRNNFSSPTVTNCIIWNNTTGGSTTTASASVSNSSSTPTFRHSLIANSGGSGSWASAIGTDGGNNIDADPLFVNPLAPGLNTGGDYSLQVGSPAIDAGDAAAWTATGLTTDAAGNTRPVGIVDMGAFESQVVCATLTMAEGDVIQPQCFGGDDGIVSVVVTGGTWPYMFSWDDDASTDSVRTGLSAGSYTVNILDNDGCADALTFILGQPSQLVISLEALSDETCSGAADGSIEVSATGGTGAISFSWSNSATGDLIENLTAGFYTVTATDGNACTAVLTEEVSVPTCPATGMLTWTGASDTNWNNPCNWDAGCVPTADNDVTIPNVTNDPVIMGSTTSLAKSVLVQAGAVLTVDGTSSLTINGSINVNGFLNAIYSEGTIQNNGQIIIGTSPNIGNYGIWNLGIFNNNGTISIDHVNGLGLYLYGGTFTNAGEIFIGNTALPAQDCIQLNGGSLINTSTGEITLNRAWGNGIWNLSGNVQNSGKITVGSIANTTTGILSFVPFTNNAGAEIHIDRVGNGIVSTNAFTNAGLIRMGENAPLTGSGIANVQGAAAVFNNNAGGDISIKQTAVDGVQNDLNSTFNNNACATLSIFDNLNNSGTFTNAGLFTVNTAQAHSNTALTNNGIIAYPQGNPIPNMTNNEIIIAPTTANTCHIISPAFGLGSPVDFTIAGIFTDEAATMSAGTYVTATNTFTPTVSLVDGMYSYFVQITDPVGGCTRVLPWDLTTEKCIAISGNILWEHDGTTPVPDATVTLSGDDMGNNNTDANGDYAIPTFGGNLTLTPTKTTGDAYEGVDVADVTRIQQHVTFIDRLDDGYKVIAADVNQSNSVTGLDAAVIFQALNGNSSAQVIFEDPSWRFVEATHTFIDENAPWTPAFPEDISLTNVMANVIDQDFVGVKMGDVNGSWATPLAPLTAPLNWTAPNLTLKAGQTLRVPFRANGLPDVAAWQFALRFDTDYLRFERALPTAAFPLKDENFGAWQAGRGELRSVFAVPQGLVLPKDEVLFELEFQVVYDGLRLSEVLRLDDDILDGRVYDTALNGGAVALTFEAVATRRIASLLPGEAALGFALEQNMPNPFSNETLVRFELPEAGEAVFTVHDVQGRLLYEQRGFLDAGLHEVRLDAARLGATGVLSYTLRCGAHSATRRMVLVR